jgi:hypothetical protein
MEEHLFPTAEGVGEGFSEGEVRGELKIKFSIPNPIHSAHLVHSSA